MIDFHCHLDLYPDPNAVARECTSRGIYVLSVTTTPSAWRVTSTLGAGSKTIRTALGLHPQLAGERKAELSLFEALLPDARYVGEVGLDGSEEFRSSWQEQLFVFNRVLSICKAAGGRIISVHSRRAVPEVLEVLGNHRESGTSILHWYSGNIRDLTRAIDLGCWFSVGPSMISSQKGLALVARMPSDRILTETDGPFAQIAGRSAVPWDVPIVVDALARIWALSPEAAEQRLRDNLRSLLQAQAPSPI